MNNSLPSFYFVYGTLKKGHGNNVLLNKSEYIGEAVTKEKFVMTDGGFPYVLRPEDMSNEMPVGHILGEIYRVDDPETVQSLNWLEGVNENQPDRGHYKLVNVDLQLMENHMVMEGVNMYLATPDTAKYISDNVRLAKQVFCPLGDGYVWD